MSVGKYKNPFKQEKSYLLTWIGEEDLENQVFSNLLKARIQARIYYRSGLFLSLININGIPLTI